MMARSLLVAVVLLAGCEQPSGSAVPTSSGTHEPTPTVVASPSLTAGPTAAFSGYLSVELPITDPLCGSVQVLYVTGEWAWNAPPDDIVAALAQLQEIEAALAVAIPLIPDDAIREPLELGRRDLADAIVLFGDGEMAEGLRAIEAIRPDVGATDLEETTGEEIHCGIGDA